MKKAIFSSKQPAVRFTEINGKTIVQICLNEKEFAITTDRVAELHLPITQYEYDFNEWVEEDVDTEGILADPTSYLNYQPEAELTDKEKIEKALANSEYAVILAGGDP